MGTKTNVIEVLKTNNFIMVTGKPERSVGGRIFAINLGVPCTWDWNNGVTAIYDLDGNPWVTRGCVEPSEIGLTEQGRVTITDPDFVAFKRGAYVPLSNDGGEGIRRLFPDKEEVQG